MCFATWNGTSGYTFDRITLNQRMIDIASEFIVAPQPDVDYGKLVAEMPKIRHSR
jgi:hypothetical protein